MNILKKLYQYRIVALTKILNYCVLMSLAYYFLFPQYAYAVLSGMDKNKVLRFSVLSSEIINKYPSSVFGKIQKVDYFLQVRQQELDLIQKAEKEKSLAVASENKALNLEVKISKPVNASLINIPAKPQPKVSSIAAATNVESMYVVITAYSSTPDQTDSSPFITASGKHVGDGIIASNFLPFGTKVKFPALFGEKLFTVEDRMKSNTKVDIWFPDRASAKKFGLKRSEMVIVSRPAKYAR